MFKHKFGKKRNKNYEDIHFTCTIRFLDDSEPITVTFQVKFVLLKVLIRVVTLILKSVVGGTGFAVPSPGQKKLTLMG